MPLSSWWFKADFSQIFNLLVICYHLIFRWIGKFLQLLGRQLETMDQYEALLCGLIVFFFSACLVLWMTRHSTNEETFDKVLKEREEKFEIPVGTKKDKKRKLKKGKATGGEKKKTEKQDVKESASADTDVDGESTEPQYSKPSAVRPDDVVQKPQQSGRSLDSGTLHQRKTKTKGESEISRAKDDADIQVRPPVERVSGKSVEPKVVSKLVNRSDGSDKRGRMEELDEIYPIEVGNWSYATDTDTSYRSTEHSFVTDVRKKSWHESTFRGLDAISKNNVT